MSIRKKGRRFEVRIGINGRLVERRLPVGATKRDAIQLEQRLRKDAVAIAAGRQPDRTIRELLDEWERVEGVHQRGYSRALKYQIGVLRVRAGSRRIHALGDLVREIVAGGTDAGLKPATINRYTAIIRRASAAAVEWGWLDRPAATRKLPERNERNVRLTRSDVSELERFGSQDIAGFIRLAAFTGCRRGELFALTPDMLRDDCLHLPGHLCKSGRGRVIPLPAPALEIARTLPLPRMTPRQFQAKWEAARKAAGMPWLHFHDLRHVFANWLDEAGVPAAVIRDLLGHHSLKVTSRYLSARQENLRAAVALLKVG